ncbi:MAG: flavodoxin [Bacteroidales bacterium]
MYYIFSKKNTSLTMKSIYTLAFLSLFLMFTPLLWAQSQAKKTLVVYFTLPETDGVDASTGASRMVVDGKSYGTTEYVASLFAKEIKADVHEIKTVHQYPGTHKALIEYAKKEAQSKTYPKLASKLNDAKDYDVIFIGYPNWWYDMPMPIYSFLQAYDFSGKTIIPFCTHGGSGFSESVANIAHLAPKAVVKQGPAISRSRLDKVEASILKWLQENPIN